MMNRPDGGIRSVDAILLSVTHNLVVAAVLLHAALVFAVAYGWFRLLSPRLGIAAVSVTWAAILAGYVYFYLTWGFPMVR